MNITTNINNFIDNYYKNNDKNNYKNNDKNNDKNDDTIRIYFSDIKNTNDNIMTNMKLFNEKDINFLISNLKKYKQNNLIKTITQDQYYSQIRETNNKDKNIDIYVLELNLLTTYDNNSTTSYIIKSNKIKQDKLSFPNLNVYHFTRTINQHIINLDGIKIIIEDNKNIYLEINKNYDKNILDEILNSIY
jgi:hypothetical protein